MTIQLDLPDNIARYIEYIPKDYLSEIIGNLIEDSVRNKSSIQADAASMQANTEDINKIMSFIESLSKREVVLTEQVTTSTPVEANQVKQQEEVEEKKPVVISVADIDINDLDDLDGLEDMLDMMK